MADVFPTLSTVEEIVEMHAKLESLKLTMAARRHGGAGKSGRYMKHDTARLSFIDGQALRDLACGKLPSAADQRALFDLPGDLEIAGKPEEKEMDTWRDQHHADPRSKAHKDAGLSVERQTTLLGWVHRNAAAFARPSAPVGTMSTYKLGFGPYAGYTLMDLVRDGNLGRLTWTSTETSGARKVPGGPHLLWMARSMDYRFPEHTRLYLGLRELDRDGVLVMGNGVRNSGQLIDSSRIHAAYVAWMKPVSRLCTELYSTLMFESFNMNNIFDTNKCLIVITVYLALVSRVSTHHTTIYNHVSYVAHVVSRRCAEANSGRFPRRSSEKSAVLRDSRAVRDSLSDT